MKFCTACGNKLPEIVVCKKCGTELAPNTKFCTKCGNKLAEGAVCKNCGTELAPNTKFCTKCGHRVEEEIPATPAEPVSPVPSETVIQPPPTPAIQPPPTPAMQTPPIPAIQTPAEPESPAPVEPVALPPDVPEIPIPSEPATPVPSKPVSVPPVCPAPNISYQQPAEIYPVQIEKRNSKNVIIYVLLSIIILGMGAFAYFFFISKESSNSDNRTERTEERTEERQEEKEVIEDSAWETENPNNHAFPDQTLMSLPTGGSMNQFAYLSYTFLTPEDLQYFTSDELRILRNAIFALHGYIFQSPELQEYFGRFYDYQPVTRNTPDFNSTENANVALIKAYEEIR